MPLRFHEIAERRHRILNPFTGEQLQLLGEICEIHDQTRHLDLCCGKGEMLCQWSAQYGLHGVGVDISRVFLSAARARAIELNCADRVTFLEADAATFAIPPVEFDIVSCIGATWIGDGLVGTLDKMRSGLRDHSSLLLVGEPYWIGEPPDAAYTAIGDESQDNYASLPGTLARFESANLELIEMVLADPHGWDRYVAAQWKTVSDFLRANPDDPDAEELRRWHHNNQREYLKYLRPYLGWGVFVLRES